MATVLRFKESDTSEHSSCLTLPLRSATSARAVTWQAGTRKRLQEPATLAAKVPASLEA